MANIFVTGATGFIGQALCKKLHAENHNIVTVVRDSNEAKSLDFVKKVYGDIRNYDIVRRVISTYEPEQVYHLASQAIVRQCARDPITAYQVNVMGAVNILESIRQCGDMVKSILVSTSDKAYGHVSPPYNESTPFQPKFTYECTKTCQDIVTQNYFHNYNLPTKIARCSNVYGPNDPNTSRLIPNTINKLLANQSPQIYQDVANYIREWIYIDDVVNAFLKISTSAKPGENYCIGATDSRLRSSVKEIVSLLVTLCDVKVTIEYPKRINTFKEIQQQYMDGKKIAKLGWQPTTSLLEGLQKTVDFYRAQK